MLVSEAQAAISQEQFSVARAIEIGWRRKWMLVLGGIIGMVLVAVWMKVVPPLYSAEMVVSPTLQLSGSKMDLRTSIDDITSGMGDFSSLLGSSSGGGTKEFRRFLAMTVSRAVAERVYADADLLHRIFYKQWDAGTKTWKPRGALGQASQKLDAFFGLPTFPAPTIEDVQKFLQSAVVVKEDKLTGTAALMAQTKDKGLGPILLRTVHAEADSILREAALLRAQEQLGYIQGKLDQVMQSDQRKGMIRLLITQESQIMMAQANVPYAADIVVPPSSREKPVSPSPKLFLIMAAILGGLLVFVFFVFYDTRPGAGSRGKNASDLVGDGQKGGMPQQRQAPYLE